MRNSIAAVFTGQPNQLELWEIPLPELRQNEMLVEILGCTICPSDLHSIHGRRQTPVPSILGHEIVGRIVATSANANRSDIRNQPLQIGDRIAWAVIVNCGNCFYCLNGLTQKCVSSIKYGHSRFQPERELLGGFAEFCLLLADAHVIRLPESIALETACPAGCGTATSAAALELAGELSGRDLLIFGAGMLGLTLSAMARVAGANQIVCVDPNPKRACRALEFGASAAISPAELPDLQREANHGYGFDVAWETSANPAAFELALNAVRLGGKLIELGAVYPVAPAALPLEQVVKRNLTIHGQHNYAPRHLFAAIDFLENHGERFPFSSLVEKWITLSELPAAVAPSRCGDSIRVGVKPR
jgi:alcohol dehydrogenase